MHSVVSSRRRHWTLQLLVVIKTGAKTRYVGGSVVNILADKIWRYVSMVWSNSPVLFRYTVAKYPSHLYCTQTAAATRRSFPEFSIWSPEIRHSSCGSCAVCLIYLLLFTRTRRSGQRASCVCSLRIDECRVCIVHTFYSNWRQQLCQLHGGVTTWAL